MVSPTSPPRSNKGYTGEQAFVIDEISAFEKALKNFDSNEVEGKLDDILSGGNGKDYLSRIRERKQIEVIARQEREKRRRKALVEQQQAQKQMEDKRREELILEKLAKQSQEERNLASKLLQSKLEYTHI
jgi:dynactin complex subunit